MPPRLDRRPRIVTRRSLIKYAIEKAVHEYDEYLRQRRGFDHEGRHVRSVVNNLMDLDPETATVEDVDRTIGYQDFLRLYCVGCDSFVDRAVEFDLGDISGEEYVNVCDDCLGKWASLLKKFKGA